MPDLEELLDIVPASIAIIIISVFITLAWMSTYVRDQPVVATAVVVFQQESSSSNEESTRNDISASSSESQNATTSQESDVNPIPNQEEEKSCTDSSKVDKQEDIQTGTENSESTSTCKTSTGKTSTASGQPESEFKSQISEDLEPSPIPEEGSCDSASSLLNRTVFEVEEESSTDTTSATSQSKSNVNGEAELEYEELPEETIRIKLKFLDDTQRLVRGQLTEEVGTFKRSNFNSELSTNCAVRLIFNGQLLNRDATTLGQYGLFDNCVVHCHVSQPQPSIENVGSTNSISQENDGLDISELLSPLLLVIVAFLWYIRYEYSHVFNHSATIILVCLTTLLLISQYALTISFNITLGYENGTNSSTSNRSATTNSNRPVTTTSGSSSITSATTTSSSITPTTTSSITPATANTVESVIPSSTPQLSLLPETLNPNGSTTPIGNSASNPESNLSLRNRSLPANDSSFTLNNHVPNPETILLNS